MNVIADVAVRPWSISWQGHTWTDDDTLTAADLCRLQILVGDSWGSVNPWASPLHLVSMIAVLAARTVDADPLEVLPIVHAMPAAELVGAIQPRTPDPQEA